MGSSGHRRNILNCAYTGSASATTPRRLLGAGLRRLTDAATCA